MHVAGEVLGATTQAVGKDRRVPVDLAADRARIRVDQQLVRVETHPFARRVAAVHAVAVQLARTDPLQIPVPDVARLLGQCHARRFFAVRLIEEAQLDAGGVLGEDSKTGALPVPGGPERVRATWPDRERHQSRRVTIVS